MPNTHDTLASLFNDIADAIREKDGTSENIVADTFPDRIAAIPVSTKTKFYIEAIKNTTIALIKIGRPTTGTCTYGIDDESTPTSYTYGNNISLNAGEKCYFSITSSSTAFSISDYLRFTSTGNINAGGNISSLIGGDLTIPRNYCFHSLFYKCSKLISIQDLVLDPTTLADSCYSNMFCDCTSLISIPSNLLPVTKLATSCYVDMFHSCTSLTNVPNLPATTLKMNCYQSMFYGCTSLTTLPSNLLPATTLASYCYSSMFYGCTSLINVPNLPAMTLATSCYVDMFYGCTSLTTLPSNLLPAMTLATSCYVDMFHSCTSLTNVPNLPAMTLKMNCYQSMFYSCTSLTTVPNLQAITLANNCYQQMFYGCSKIKLSETQLGNYQTSFRIPRIGAGTSGKYSLLGMFTNTGGTFTGTPDINKTYYLWEYANVDVSDTTATASDVLTGKYFYTSNGTKTEGTLGIEVESKDVDFYDYDGTRLYSYTKQEFLALNEMPANPTHDGLTSQGWNWSLADAKEQVTDFNQLNIGQMYVTDDNKTRLYIHLESVRLTPYLSFCVNGSVLVEWGDGTSETVVGTSTSTILSTPHTYSQGGDYVIKLSSSSTIYFNFSGNDNVLHGNGIANNYYSCSVTKIELGGTVELNRYGFHDSKTLKSITMPNTITALHTEFYGCVSLLFVVIPINVATSNGSLFQTIYGLTTYCFPKGLTLNGGIFNSCRSLQKLIIPPSTTSVPSQICRFCYSLVEVVFAKGTTAVGALAFQNCYSVKLYDFRKATSVPTLANTNAFDNISADCKIVVPDSLYAAWIIATNWSNYASYIVKESEYVG